MSIIVNGIEIENVNFNSTTLDKVIYNGVVVWESLKSITIDGTAKKGNILTATVVPSTAKVSYQWYRGDTAISGATNSTYTIVSGDVGYQLHCKASTSSKTVDSNYTEVVDYIWTGQSSEKTNDSGSDYVTNIGVSWNFSGVRLTYAYSEGNDKNGDSNYARVFVTTSDGKYNNTQIASAYGVNVGATWNGTIDNVTYVACDFNGTNSVKELTGKIRYYTHN